MGGRRPKPAPGRGPLGLSGAQRLAGACAVVLVSAAAGAWFATALHDRDAPPAAPPQLDGRLAIAGVAQPVRIDRDRHGVPYIDAASEADAFFALGYSQAQDRIGQLLALRQRARGTAAEQHGEVALDGDRLARLLDFRGLAERQWERLPRAARSALEAYAAGVEGYLERVRRGEEATPRGLRDEPIEAWRPQDSLALFKLFAWGLSGSIDASLLLNELVAALGPIDAARFFPLRESVGLSAGRVPAPGLAWVSRGARSLRGAFGLSGHGVGSSAFVVGGAHGESGGPVLVADSHFEPTAPAALYLAHLRTPDLDVAGATLAGVPVFWWGRNPRLAWACVNAGAVVTDLYTETLRANGSEYHDGRRWRPVVERSEHLVVRRGADRTLAVRSTTRGPLLPSDGEPREAISVAWSGARVRGESGIASLLAVARSGSGDALRAALRRHHEPPIALLYASASGEAGLQVAGWIPHRTLAAQLLPLPGRARWYEWQEAVPFESLPAAQLAERGFLVAADQPFSARGAEAPIDAVWRSGARAARLETLLSDATRERVDLRRLASLGGDDLLARSRTLIDTALELLGDARRGEEAGELERWLREWDGHASAGSVGAAVYHVFLGVLAEALFEKRLGKELFERTLAVEALDLEGLVLGVLRDAASSPGRDVWSDPEPVRQAIGRSLRETWLALSFRLGPDPRQWRWGRIHRLHFRDVGSRRTLFGPFDYGGGPHAVQAAAYPAGDPFDVSVAATGRFAVDAGTLDLALAALAPGQSEHGSSGSPPDGLRDWLAGRYALIATRRLEIDDRSVAQLVLEPVR